MDTQTDLEVLQRLLENRYSCRAFTAQAVPRETMETWLRTAQRTASWCNTQPWQLVITSGEATQEFRDALLKVVATETQEPDFPFPEEYRGACLARRRETGAQLYQSVGIARGDREAADRQMMENFCLFGAPHVAIITTDRYWVCMAQWIPACMSAPCWSPRRRWGWPASRRRRLRAILTLSAATSVCRKSGVWSARCRSALPRPGIRQTVFVPRVRRLTAP